MWWVQPGRLPGGGGLPRKTPFLLIVHVCFFASWLLLFLSALPCFHLTPPDPKLYPIPLTPNGHLDLSLPLCGHLGPVGTTAPARLSLQPDPMLVALGSRKSSVMSLGRVSYDQRSLVSPVGGSDGCSLLGVRRDPGEKRLPAQLQTGTRPRAPSVQPEPGRDYLCCISGFPVPEWDQTARNE